MGSGAGLAQAVANNPKLKEALQRRMGFAPQAAPPPPPPPAPTPAPQPAQAVTPYKPESLAPNSNFGGQMSLVPPPKSGPSPFNAVNLYPFRGPNSQGDNGFGMGALERARAAGLSDAKIKASLYGMNVGPDAAAALGIEAGLFDTIPTPTAPPPDIYSNAGADGSTGATGFKSKKSSWKTSGQSTKGTSNLKLKIQGNASGTGLNISG